MRFWRDPTMAGAWNAFMPQLSVALVVAIVGLSKTLAKVFTFAPIAWLGKISFSLYLVHEAVILAFVYSTRADPVAIVASVVLSFPIAWLFFKLVEEPAHNFSKRIGAPKQALAA